MSTVKKSFSSIAHNLQSSKKYFAAKTAVTLAQTLFRSETVAPIDANGSSGAAQIAKCRDIVRSRLVAMPATLVNRNGHTTIAKNGDGFLDEVIAKRARKGDFDRSAAFAAVVGRPAAAMFKTRALGGDLLARPASRGPNRRVRSPLRMLLGRCKLGNGNAGRGHARINHKIMKLPDDFAVISAPRTVTFLKY